LLPAFTPHRVWVGQWFLTPNYENRVAAYEALTGNPAEFDRLRELLDGQRIRYLVIPSNHTAFLAERLDGRTQEMVPCGRLDLLVLR
jgi:hypothetical protein